MKKKLTNNKKLCYNLVMLMRNNNLNYGDTKMKKQSILSDEIIQKLKENGKYTQCKSKKANTKQTLKSRNKTKFQGKAPYGNGVSSIYDPERNRSSRFQGKLTGQTMQDGLSTNELNYESREWSPSN